MKYPIQCKLRQLNKEDKSLDQLKYTKKRRKGKHLTFEDRQLIEYYFTRKRKKRNLVSSLIELIGVSESTIRRELKRGKVILKDNLWKDYTSYSSEIAQRDADFQNTGKGPDIKLFKDYDLVAYIEKEIIENKMSPDAVIMNLDKRNWKDEKGNKFSVTICTKTLYNYIDIGLFPNLTNKQLPRRGRTNKRKQRRVRRSSRKTDGKSILERPKAADMRSEYGHWEMDCIEGAKGKERQCLLTLVERKTREALIFKMSSQSQRCVINVLNKLERKTGRIKFLNIFKSITVDNGSEFLDDKGMEKSLFSKNFKRTNIYYAHPYCSWERGSNEHSNGMIRRFIPKGSLITSVKVKRIKEIELWLNNYPRRMFDGASAYEFKKDVIKRNNV